MRNGIGQEAVGGHADHGPMRWNGVQYFTHHGTDKAGDMRCACGKGDGRSRQVAAFEVTGYKDALFLQTLGRFSVKTVADQLDVLLP